MKVDFLVTAKVLQRKDGVKMVIIPKSSNIKKDDYVGIFKLNIKEVENNGK